MLLPSALVGAWTLDNSVTSEIELSAGTTMLISISEYEADLFISLATSTNDLKAKSEIAATIENQESRHNDFPFFPNYQNQRYKEYSN